MNMIHPIIIVISFIINLISIAVILYEIYIRQNVLRKRNLSTIFASIIFILVPISLTISCITAINTPDAGSRRIITLFITTVVFLILTRCATMYIEGIESVSMDVVKAIVGVLEAGDPNLDGHSLHVQRLSMLLYEFLPQNDKILINPYNLKCASLLLDIGKLGIPRSIINKSGKLGKDEWEIMRRHPEIGVKILKQIPSFSEILPWIKYHHERVDGNGYYHLASSEIPIESRIIAIADTYSALTMNRSYKARLPYDDAIAELKLCAGSQLDKELVEIFCSIPIRRIEACMTEVMKTMKCYEEENFR